MKNKAKAYNSVLIQDLLSKVSLLEKRKIKERMQLATQIDKLIALKGYNKSSFAKAMGKNPSEITKWLSGTHNFTLDTLIEIAVKLNVTIEQLFEINNTQPVSTGGIYTATSTSQPSVHDLFNNIVPRSNRSIPEKNHRTPTYSINSTKYQ